MASALRAPNTLWSVELFGNQIGDNGARWIAEALEENTQLRRLKLGTASCGCLFCFVLFVEVSFVL